MFLTSWGRFQRHFSGILDDLTKHGELIDKETNAENIIEARKMRQDLETWRTESLASMARAQREQTTRQVQGVIAWLRLDDSDQLSLLDNLSEVGARHPGTVSWVLKKRQMSSWMQCTTENQFVWLHGKPGTGKSVIVAQLVGFLATAGQSLVIHHFCSYNHTSSTLYDEIIKAILLQCLRADSDLLNYVYEEYAGAKSASITLLEKLLETAVETLGSGGRGQRTIHILLDGLEECAQDKQERLIRIFERLMTAGASCKVLIASRDFPLTRVKRKKPSLVSLSDEKAAVTDAIYKFVDTELLTMRDQLEQLKVTEEERWKIASGISKRADGEFKLHPPQTFASG